MPDDGSGIVPQCARTSMNCQRVPMVDPFNPFIARPTPSPEESTAVIRFADPKGVDFKYLPSRIHRSWLCRATNIVVPGGKMAPGRRLIFLPLAWRPMARRKPTLGLT
jgi:phosphoribulokinase